MFPKKSEIKVIITSYFIQKKEITELIITELIRRIDSEAKQRQETVQSTCSFD